MSKPEAIRPETTWPESIKAEELRILMHRHARVYDVSGVGTAMTSG